MKFYAQKTLTEQEHQRSSSLLMFAVVPRGWSLQSFHLSVSFAHQNFIFWQGTFFEHFARYFLLTTIFLPLLQQPFYWHRVSTTSKNILVLLDIFIYNTLMIIDKNDIQS